MIITESIMVICAFHSSPFFLSASRVAFLLLLLSLIHDCRFLAGPFVFFLSFLSESVQRSKSNGALGYKFHL
jgi:hypothetical protein